MTLRHQPGVIVGISALAAVLILWAVAYVFALSPSPAKPIMPTYAILLPSENVQDSRTIPLDEATKQLGFRPAWPTILPPNIKPEPVAVVFLVPVSLLELRYSSGDFSSGDKHFVEATLQQGRSGDDVHRRFRLNPWEGSTLPYWKNIVVRGVSVTYEYDIRFTNGTSYSELFAAWQQHGISYGLTIHWAREIPPDTEPTVHEREAFAFIEGVIAAANAS